MRAFVFCCMFGLFNVSYAGVSNSGIEIKSEQDFHWSLVRLSSQVELSNVLYKHKSNYTDTPWYRKEKHIKNIMEEIPHMIADCALKRGVFADVKDSVVRFGNTDISIYTDANKNAYLLYNYVYSQMYRNKRSVAEIGEMLSESGKNVC